MQSCQENLQYDPLERPGYLKLVRNIVPDYFLLLFWIDMGGFRSFFIESKLFQLGVEEGGNFFSLRIFERGKYFMQSVFMGKNAT